MIVHAQTGSLTLDTGMTQSAFSKARITQRLSEQGLLAQKRDNSWQFTPWAFTGTRLAETEDGKAPTVLLEGNGFEGATLGTLLGGDDAARSACAAATVCAVLEESLRQNSAPVPVGGGGIIVAQDFSKVLFLPHERRCSAAGTKPTACRTACT